MNPNESKRDFVRLVTKHERMLYGYILSLVPQHADADEIIQETNLRLWDEFNKYVPGTSFAAWALKVAHFQVLTWRKKKKHSKLVFDDNLVEALAKQRDVWEEACGPRHEALIRCVHRLPEHSRSILAECYGSGSRIKDIAARLQRTEASVYKVLERLRKTLYECIQRSIGEEMGK